MTGDIGPNLAATERIKAEASVKVAKATHSTPSIQNTIRTLGGKIVIAGSILLIGYMGIEHCPETTRHYVLWGCTLGIGGLLVHHFVKKN